MFTVTAATNELGQTGAHRILDDDGNQVTIITAKASKEVAEWIVSLMNRHES
jgi:hypothetical protein